MGRRKVVSRGDRNIAWVEQHLFVPEGKDVGKPIRLREWQRDILRGIYNSPTRRAIISFARKAGKTSLSAMLVCLHICGPEARPNSQVYSAAQSRDQAAILYALAAKMLRMNSDLMRYVHVRDHEKTIGCPELGTIYRALSADAATAYGLSPVLVIHDEAGQIKGPRSALYEALETASAAHTDPLSIVISTQAPTDADLLSVLIDDAKTGQDPRTKLFLYTASEDLDPFGEEALQAANPAMGDFASAVELLAMAADAKRMPSREAEYRQLLLNQRVEAVNPFVSKTVWDLNGGPISEFAGHPVFCGLDLSETSDLTAFVMAACIDGVWHVKPLFWLPEVGLAERARKDRVPYDLWHQQGLLHVTPGAAVEYSHVARLIYDICNDMDIRTVNFDRYGMRHLKPWLGVAGFSEEEIEATFIEFGQGFVSMGPAVREMEALLLNAKVRHGDHPILTMCAANAVTESDPAGNRKLSKRRSRGRIDGMVCLAMALSAGVTAAQPVVFTSIFDDPALFPELHTHG